MFLDNYHLNDILLFGKKIMRSSQKTKISTSLKLKKFTN